MFSIFVINSLEFKYIKVSFNGNGNCHEVGHNRRTCQAAAASSRPPPPQSPDDRLIEEYLTSLDEITPATYAV